MSEVVRLYGERSSDWIWWRVKGRGGFPCLNRRNVIFLGINEAEKEPVTCDSHLKREIQGRDRGKVAHAALGGCD